MKIKQTVIYGFIAVILTLAITACPEPGDGSINDFTFEGTTTLTITGYTGPGGALIIPSAKGGIPITAIKDGEWNSGVFRDKSLTSVTIPNSIISIGDYAFYGKVLVSKLSNLYYNS